jgi:hypothetical protein
VCERVGPDGVVEPLALESLPELDGEVEAVAVCLASLKRSSASNP